MRASAMASAVLAAGLAASAGACSSSSNDATSSARPAGSGPVDVLYAGSLSKLMTKTVGPAFTTTTGYTFNGTSGESGTLANEIKGKTVVGDVFISANPSKDQALEGAANGNWVTWYGSFATSPLVLGYNPKSSFASGFQSQPWYQAVNHPGLLLGRTDPATDPKGVLTVTALNAAAASFNEPRLAADAKDTSTVFPETSLVGRLQAGQLDAGFFYSVEATAAGINFIPVSAVGTLQAQYTITILDHAPDPAAARAFVGYLLGYDGQQMLTKAGINLQTPVSVSGTAPSSVREILSGA